MFRIQLFSLLIFSTLPRLAGQATNPSLAREDNVAKEIDIVSSPARRKFAVRNTFKRKKDA